MRITFTGNYSFLSNFYECPVFWDGRLYRSSEAAYQSAKCLNIEDRDQFTKMNPAQAKRKGRRVLMRPDWYEIKNEVMYDICSKKFEQNSDLMFKLISTGDASLVEENTWGDRYWGVCNNSGKNELGKILMKIREEHKPRLI